MSSFEDKKGREKINTEVGVDSSWVELAEGFPDTSSKGVECKIEASYKSESLRDFDAAVEAADDDVREKAQAIVDKANEIKITAEAQGRGDLVEKMAQVASEAATVSAEGAKEIIDLKFTAQEKVGKSATYLDALAKETKSLEREADKLYDNIQELEARRKEVGTKADEKLLAIVGVDFPVFGLGERFQEDQFKGAIDVNRIMSGVGNDLRDIRNKWSELEVSPFLRFGILGKLKDFFTKSPIIGEMLQIDEKASPLWERWYAMKDQIKKQETLLYDEKQRRKKNAA